MKRISRARWRPQRRPGQMNATEARFAVLVLDVLKAAGKVVRWEYEPMKFRLGAGWDCTYTPDFAVFLSNGEIEMIDVKGSGGWEEKARVKIKAALRLYPEFHWVGYTESKGKRGAFVREEFT